MSASPTKTSSTRPPQASSRKPKRSRTTPLRLPIRASYAWPDYPISPHQGAFLALPCLEALYGGAAGGGKSDALLRAALQYVDVPGYKALLMRRNYPQLAQAGGLIDRSKMWLTGKATWNDSKHRWTFPSGAILEFGHLQQKDSHFNYQGAEYDFIGIDELTHIPEEQYLYMFSRLRSTEESPVPVRMRAASNPGGRGHVWVKRRFIDKKPDPSNPNDSSEKAKARIFIPARVEDNPGLNVREYLTSLEQLDPQTFAQLRDGDWNARGPGDWVYNGAGIDAAVELGRMLDGNPPEPAGGAISLGIDWGENTAGLVIWPLERGGIYVPNELILTSEEPGVSTGRLLRMADNTGQRLEDARYDAAGVQSMRTFTAVARRTHPHLRTVKVSFGQFKVESINHLRRLFDRAAKGETTQIIAISPTGCPTLIEQLRGLQWKDPDAQIVEKGDDHAPDALIAGDAPIAKRMRKTT
ncbi:MAG: terminase family protein [Solirubrobacterales bacterium]|nr:terminase family protein [Solirubrobacterales bacterium]